MRRKFRRALTPRKRRHVRVRAKVSGHQRAAAAERVSSSAHIYAQVIDDDRGHTLVAASDLEQESSIAPATEATKSAGQARSARSSASGPKRPASTRSSSTAADSSITGGSRRSPKAPARPDWPSRDRRRTSRRADSVARE